MNFREIGPKWTVVFLSSLFDQQWSDSEKEQD